MILTVSQMVKKEVGGRWAGPRGEGQGRASDTHPPGAARRRLLERAVSAVPYIWKGAEPTNESKYHKSVLTVSSSMNLDAFRKAGGASAFRTSLMNLDDICTPKALAFRT